MKRRVVVTGLGMVTPVGNDVATTWRALLDGMSGAAPITKFDASTFPVRFACEVKGFDPLQYMDRKEAKRSDQYSQYAIAGAVQAMTDSGLGAGALDDALGERTGVILGSGIGGLKSFEEQHDQYRERGASKISPFFIPMFIADIAAGLVSMRFRARGPNYATVSACSTGAHAIGEAFRTIQYGDADVMLSGGTEATVTPMAIGGFANMKALSERNDSPATASRPFDLTRDGFAAGANSVGREGDHTCRNVCPPCGHGHRALQESGESVALADAGRACRGERAVALAGGVRLAGAPLRPRAGGRRRRQPPGAHRRAPGRGGRRPRLDPPRRAPLGGGGARWWRAPTRTPPISTRPSPTPSTNGAPER